MGGRSLAVWVYDTVPEGVRLATLRDLQPGRPVLYQVRIGPDAGKYYQDYVRPSTYQVLLRMLQDGVPVFINK